MFSLTVRQKEVFCTRFVELSRPVSYVWLRVKRRCFFLQGSGVSEGAKYVIRTEVLYEVDKSERIDATKD